MFEDILYMTKELEICIVNEGDGNLCKCSHRVILLTIAKEVLPVTIFDCNSEQVVSNCQKDRVSY